MKPIATGFVVLGLGAGAARPIGPAGPGVCATLMTLKGEESCLRKLSSELRN